MKRRRSDPSLDSHFAPSGDDSSSAQRRSSAARGRAAGRDEAFGLVDERCELRAERGTHAPARVPLFAALHGKREARGEIMAARLVARLERLPRRAGSVELRRGLGTFERFHRFAQGLPRRVGPLPRGCPLLFLGGASLGAGNRLAGGPAGALKTRLQLRVVGGGTRRQVSKVALGLAEHGARARRVGRIAQPLDGDTQLQQAFAPRGHANRVVVGEDLIQHRARPLAHACERLRIVRNRQQHVGIVDAREGRARDLRTCPPSGDAAQQGDIGDARQRLEADLRVRAPPRDFGKRPLLRDAGQSAVTHVRMHGTDGDRHQTTRSSQAGQRACAVLRWLARRRTLHEQVFRSAGGQHSQFLVRVGVSDLQQQLRVVELLDREAADAHVLVGPGDRGQEVACVPSEVADRGGAHLRIATTPRGKHATE
jgi:hypothetical protein